MHLHRAVQQAYHNNQYGMHANQTLHASVMDSSLDAMYTSKESCRQHGCWGKNMQTHLQILEACKPCTADDRLLRLSATEHDHAALLHDGQQLRVV